MLRGHKPAKLDEKGRLKLPSAFRSDIETRFGREFFVTSIHGNSALLYPMKVWERIEQKLAEAPSMKPSVIRFRNAVNYYGQCATMDRQGRILVHPLLREKAGVNGEVSVLGQQDHLEVWNRATFETRLEEDPLTNEDLAELADAGF